MPDNSIELRNLRKYYTISQRKGFSFLDIPEIVRTRMSVQDTVIKVLDGIDLDIRKGECFGIIGPNGTGKSTLLRIISGIIPPDSGSVRVNGTLIPLLSLNVGFTGDLSARDNVYQYGMILGFSRKEMDVLYDDIFRFADLEKFHDMPLKNFSTGMRVKLAFSTAIRINPDIIVLDEVLSVGDAVFREKSKQKILEFCKSDKTVVIVSHSMNTISDLCDRALFLQDGKIARLGETEDVIAAYLASMQHYFEPDKGRIPPAIPDVPVHGQRDRSTIREVSKLNIFPLIRSRFGPDTENFVNLFLTWNNFKKLSDLEELLSCEDAIEDSGGDSLLGSAVVSSVTALGTESAAVSTASEILSIIMKDGFVCFGNENLTELFLKKTCPTVMPGRISTILICSNSRTVPVILDSARIRRLDEQTIQRILNRADIPADGETTIVIPPELFSEEGLSELARGSLRFLAPVPVRELEKIPHDRDFFEGIVSADTMLIHNDRVIFGKKGLLDPARSSLGGFLYFDPKHVSPDLNTFFKRLQRVRETLGAAGSAGAGADQAFIEDVAKTDAAYFLAPGEPAGIQVNHEAVMVRQMLIGRVFLVHSGTWGIAECYRNYELWLKTDQALKFYQRIITSRDAFSRGRALLSFINSAVQIQVLKGIPVG